jgi:sterol 24-C-methyltransferase
VNHYYDLATDFYEYGWGQSFHFAPRFEGESFESSIARHEHYLASRMNIQPGQTVMDAGCGVGGPMRAIARFTGAKVTGVNNNDYQIKRANLLNQKQKLDHLCKAVKGNFMELPVKDNSFDCVYAIEALCHAPDYPAVFREMYRVCKPGGVFASFEWLMTDDYDETNEEHNMVKHKIEHGDGLPDMKGPNDIMSAVEAAGFEVLDNFDLATHESQVNCIPWYATFKGGMSLSQIRHSAIGRRATQLMTDVLETLRLAPKGTGQTHRMLCAAAEGLLLGGELGIFTPMYFVLCRKPLDGEAPKARPKKSSKAKAKKTPAKKKSTKKTTAKKTPAKKSAKKTTAKKTPAKKSTKKKSTKESAAKKRRTK